MSLSEAPSRGHIMIVDDIEDNHVLLSRALKRAGFKTEAYDNGVDAIASISSSPPDLLLLDWMMPGLSGMDVLCAVREHHNANELPIIMCTARDESSSIAQAIEAGANDYLQKPVDMPIAIARITSQLERRAALLTLADLNRNLEATLAKRTRALMERGGDNTSQPGSVSEINEILRLADWLRTPEAQDSVMLAACADSLKSAARRLAVG
jgi:DNA-binding response OmpR family regulator